jgi:RNA polymerase-binding transcription factor DksA
MKAVPKKAAPAKAAAKSSDKPAAKKAAAAPKKTAATKAAPAAAKKAAPAPAKAATKAPAKAAAATKAPTKAPTKAAAKKAAKAAPAPPAPLVRRSMENPPPLPPKRPGAPTPVAKKAPGPLTEADKKFLDEARALLAEERDTYEAQATALKAEADQLAAEMEPGDVQFDEESGEGDSIGMERERDLQLAGQARAAIEEIDRAIAKIGAGTYGICERCNQPIPKARLKALPYAALCVACKSGGLSARR